MKPIILGVLAAVFLFTIAFPGAAQEKKQEKK